MAPTYAVPLAISVAFCYHNCYLIITLVSYDSKQNTVWFHTVPGMELHGSLANSDLVSNIFCFLHFFEILS